jgi:two-component system CheB/CheR fusion protein
VVERTEAVQKTFPIVGIGASAGGLEACTQLLGSLSSDVSADMAFVVVQHLDPTHDSGLPDLLRRVTKMPVNQAENGMAVEPNHLYIIPPNADMTIAGEVLKLTHRNMGDKLHLPIDRFFRSLAENRKSQSIGIILSGTGSDGTLGLKAVKAEGGITFAQDETAKYQGMPRAAIASGCVDFILSPESIARELARISQRPFMGRLKHEQSVSTMSKAKNGLEQVFSILWRATGADFSNYKLATINRRITRRMLLHKFTELQDYTHYLADNSSEVDALYKDILIGVTRFFRDEPTFEYLINEIFPRLTRDRQAQDPVRIWVPGCATGEEAYSIAISVLESLGEKLPTYPIQIFATDLSEGALRKARTGIYSRADVSEIEPARLARFFEKREGNYQIIKSIRDMCVFAPHNILQDPPFSQLDFISCCNVLIYMNVVLQKKVFQTFHYALKPRGYLMLGKSETVGVSSELYSQIDKKYKVYARKETVLRGNMNFGRNMLGLNKRNNKDAARKAPEIEYGAGPIDIQKEADKLLLNRYSPASVVVDHNLEIMQFRGSTSMFLEPSPGKASFNLLKMAKEGLGFELRNAIYMARENGAPVRREGLQVKHNGGEVRDVAIEVIPLHALREEPCFLIVFENAVAEPMPPTRDGAPGVLKSDTLKHDVKDRRILLLEQELAQAREDMNSVTEEQEAANEELQSANEEILSSNEELQSINEELETSKEELQSTNEELTTVNQELQNRNEQLAEAQANAQAITETARESLIILTKDLLIKSANKSFYRMFRVSKEETEGSFLYNLGNGQWDILALRKLLHEVLSKSTPIEDFEVEHDFQTVGHKIMLLNARKLQQESDRTELILLAIDDITKRKKAEEILQQAKTLKYTEATASLEKQRSQLIAINKAKDEFISLASHQLRTPATGVKQFIGMLLAENFSGQLSPEQRSFLLLAYESNERQLQVINDILNVAQLDTGMVTLRKSKVNLVPLVKGIVKEQASVFDARNQDVEFTYSAGELVAFVDKTKIRMVIENIIDNASKYTPHGKKIAINVRKNENNLAVSIKDTGVGISPKDLGKLFKKFSRIDDNPLIAEVGGSGLGLYWAKEIVDLHGGSITVSSKPNQGSTFTIILPASETQDD